MPGEPYPELRSVLDAFVMGVQNALGRNFLSAYLVGSLATGDFDLDSDVDFLVVTHAELSEQQVQSLDANHADIYALGCYPARHLEGSYISFEMLRRADRVGTHPLWYVDNGTTSLQPSLHDNQWHVRWVLRERGVPLAGPDPKTLVDVVHPETLRREIVEAIEKLEQRFVAEMDQPSGWFKMRFGQSFTVLTVCRMLQTCETGTVESKRSAVEWAEHALDARWREFIRIAWTERTGVRYGEKVRQPAETQLVRETVRFLEYARRFIAP